MTEKTRCPWVPLDKPLYVRYHDEEWGVPVHDGRALFAKLCLDGAQAGLSWWSVLTRRDSYYEAFADFDPPSIVEFGDRDVESLMGNTGIIRNRLKIESVIKNARGYIAIENAHGDFGEYLWRFVGSKPVANRLATIEDYPTLTAESEEMSKSLKKYGFSFVGPTICYAFMQAVGMVNDHTVSCFRNNEVKA